MRDRGKEGGGFPGGNDQNGFQLLYLLKVSAFSLVLALPTYVFPRCEVLPVSFSFSSVSFTCHRLGFYLHYNMQPGFVKCTVCSGSLGEQEHQLACICIEPYGDWNSDWIGVFSPSSSCAWLVYDKSVALTPRVGRERECLWSDKLHIRALFNIPYMATSDELLRCQIEEQLEMQPRMQRC